jgi:hypothetical protein
MSGTLITPENPLLVPPLLAAKIGWESAMILQQIHYFSDRSKHIRPDGRRWFWLTYEGWAQKIPFLKMSTIRRAIDKLRQLKLIDVFRHSQHTWYQANWYTVNTESVKALWLSICQNQQMQVSATDISNCSEPATYIRDYSSEINSPQNTTAVGEEVLEVDWAGVLHEENEPALLERVPDYVGAASPTGEDRSTKQRLVHFLGDNASDALEKQVEEEQARLVSECLVMEEQVTLVSNQEEPAQTTDTLCVDEPEQVNSLEEPVTYEGNYSAAAPAQPVEKPCQEEINEVRRELRQLRINPDACMSAVLKHWRNVNNALARVREALADGWCKNPEGLFISSCKNGTKPQKSTAVAIGFNEWFAWARKQRIALASTTIDGVHSVYLSSDEWMPTAKAMQMYPMG